LEVGGVEDGNVLSFDLSTSVSEESLVLVSAPCGEVVVANGEGVFFVGIDLVDLSILGGVESESEVVLFNSSVGFSVGSDVLNEGLLNLGGDDLGVTEVEAQVGGSVADLHFMKKVSI
jgi:hypothetical protein